LICLSIIAFSSCWLTPGQYEEIKKVATWDLLPYNTFLELFGNKTFEQMSSRVGKQYSQASQPFLSDVPMVKAVADVGVSTAPVSFDVRQAFPQCFRPVRDQAHCGSCYAFAAVAAFEIRVCMQNRGKKLWELSPQDILQCDASNYKCEGGANIWTWQHIERFGITTEQCVPYVSGEGYVPNGCPSLCTTSGRSAYEERNRFKAVYGSLREFKSVESLKQELSTYGPVTSAMRTFEDFNAYQGGIYTYAWGRETDPHAIVIVGYGNQYGRQYWIVRNSWGAKWGENGYFRIWFGSLNDVESDACASHASPSQ